MLSESEDWIGVTHFSSIRIHSVASIRKPKPSLRKKREFMSSYIERFSSRYISSSVFGSRCSKSPQKAVFCYYILVILYCTGFTLSQMLPSFWPLATSGPSPKGRESLSCQVPTNSLDLALFGSHGIFYAGSRGSSHRDKLLWPTRDSRSIEVSQSGITDGEQGAARRSKESRVEDVGV